MAVVSQAIRWNSYRYPAYAKYYVLLLEYDRYRVYQTMPISKPGIWQKTYILADILISCYMATLAFMHEHLEEKLE